MIEKICPKCRVPMTGNKCIKQSCGCSTEVSTTIYWCEDCNIPIFDKICSICEGVRTREGEGRYISTDLRPVFPEENMLVSILLDDDPFRYQKCSMWFGSNVYIVDGTKIKLSVAKYNGLPINRIHDIRQRYNKNIESISYEYFDEYAERFVAANAER